MIENVRTPICRQTIGRRQRFIDGRTTTTEQSFPIQISIGFMASYPT